MKLVSYDPNKYEISIIDIVSMIISKKTTEFNFS